MGFKRIIEKDLFKDGIPSDSFESPAIDLYLGKNLSVQVVAEIQDDTPVTFFSPAYSVLTNQDITYTAVDPGEAGDDITITIIDPEDTSDLLIDVTGKDIVITLEYAGGNVVTDADALVAAINLDPAASLLVVASGTGSDPLTNLSETPLAGGADGDIDLSNSSIYAPGLIQGAKVQLSSDGTLPDPLVAATDYFVIKDGLPEDMIQLAETAEDAQAGIFIEFVDAGSDGAENDITPESFSSLSVEIEKSNDGVTWESIDSDSISVSGGVYFTVPSISFKYLKFSSTLSGGAVGMKVNLLVIGDAI